MRILTLVSVLLLMLVVVVFAAPAQVNLAQALADEYENGEISQAEFIAFQFFGIARPELLPQKYADYPVPFSRNSILLLQQAGELLKTVTGEEYALLKSMFSRPDSDKLPEILISDSGKFRLHYTTTGFDAAELSFVQSAAQYFDSAFNFICGVLQYQEPPADYDVDGPEWDVYIHNITGYGSSIAESPVDETLSPYDATSYVEIDNDFSTTFTESMDALRVTAYHEFFHMVQIGYRSYLSTTQNAVWLFEATAVWMEEFSCPDVNDYVQYVRSYFNHPEKPLYATDGLHEYGAGLFFLMLTEEYDKKLVRNIWQDFITKEALAACSDVLKNQYSTTLGMEMIKHAEQNFLAANGYPSIYDDEDILPPHILNAAITYPQTAIVQQSVGKLGYSAVQVDFQDSLSLQIVPSFENEDEWAFVTIKLTDGVVPQVFTSVGQTNGFVNQITPNDTLIVLPVNIKVPTFIDMIKDSFTFSLREGQPVDMQSKITKIYPNPYMCERHPSGITAEIILANETRIKVFISDENGKIVYEQDLAKYPQGMFKFHWHGENNSGDPLPTGIYLLHIQCDDKIEPKKIAIIR